MLKRLDRYIIRKFLETFFLSLSLFVLIAIVFDVVEKLEDFLSDEIPLSEILFDYYLNFIPYFAVLFTPLFLFVAVIFFTSRMAQRSEIIAMLNSGITFRRMMIPYLMSSFLVTGLNIYVNHWLIPDANKTRLAFEDAHIGYTPHNPGHNLHMQVAPGEFMYIENFNLGDSSGYRFTYEEFLEGAMVYKIRAERIYWIPADQLWNLKVYAERKNQALGESLRFGKDTTIRYAFTPDDLKKDNKAMEALNAIELHERIAEMKERGTEGVALFEVEKHKRTSFPFAIPILTVIGVSLSSRKVRGGIGLHLGLGIAISFAYILFLQFSKTFATNSDLPAIVAVWIPNLIFGLLALYLYRKAPK